jgi:hypothetical protein
MEMLDMFVATLVAVSVFLSTFFFIVEIELQCIEKMQYDYTKNVSPNVHGTV